MPYMKETAKAGKTIEVYKYHTLRPYGKKGIPRGSNTKLTPEQMQIINGKNAEKKLRLLIAENFTSDDMHLVWTYKKEKRPTPEEAKKILEKALRELRKVYKKQGRELKYIAVTEYKNKAIHHHLIINYIDAREITKIWQHGRPHITHLDNEGEYKDLAAYFVKETSKTYKEDDSASTKRWSSSKNLKQPVIKKQAMKRERWVKEPRPIKGYYIQKDSVVNGAHNYNGYEHPFQFYRMIKYDSEQGTQEKIE